MNKIYRINIITLAAIIIALTFSFSAFNVGENSKQQLPVVTDKNHTNKAAELVNSRKTLFSFRDVSLFTKNQKDNQQALTSFVSEASFLMIDKSALRDVNISKPENINFRLKDADGKDMEVELVNVELIPNNFKIKVIGSKGVSYQDFKGGLYYRGIIKGDNNSTATLSIFENNVIGIFSSDNGNYVLGSVKNESNQLTDEYIFYNDRDVTDKPDFVCGVGDSYNSKYYRGSVNNTITGNNRGTTSPVGIYFVCDYRMYLDNGSNINNVAQFVTGAFNHVKTLYLNEQLTVEISDIGVYDSPDPYVNLNTSISILEEFGFQTQNTFTGDLAHLLSTRQNNFGGIAWVNVLCQSYEPTSRSGRYAFSNIDNNYQPYPVYSFTIEVITHETGHNYGSMHTQACVWPVFQSGIGAIDSCVQAENGTCFSFNDIRANNNGTIMSYCHLNGAINFNLGFGTLPGDTIRLGYALALCLDSALNSSETPLAFNLLQNYPNPFNPGTNIKFSLPEEGFVTLKMYDLLGREIATLINNNHYSIGIFSYSLDASSYNLASGVYLYKLDVNKDNKSVYSQIKKMVLVK